MSDGALAYVTAADSGPSRHAVESTWRAILRTPVGAVSLAYLIGLVIASLCAPLVAPYSPTATDLDHILSGPSFQHPLGTDSLGRDVLSRLVYGGRYALLDAAVAVITFVVVGASSGLLAGFLGGWVDRAFTWVTDVVLAIPGIVVLLGVLAILGNSMTPAMVTLGLLGAPTLGRIVRGATLTVRQELYVTAARVSGLPSWYIMVRHVLPRVRQAIVVQASLAAGGALVISAGLSYLGFGAQPPTPTWGGMITEAASVIDRQPWLLVPPGLVLGLATLALGLLGDVVGDTTAERRGSVARRPRRRPPAIATRSVSRSYRPALLSMRQVSIVLQTARGPTTVVEDVDLDVTAGESVGLVGESGCGKSITAAAILGLLPSGGVVSAGEISFNGVDLTSHPPEASRALRGAEIAFIAQDPIASLDPVFTAGQQVDELVRRHHGGTRREVRARTLDLLRSVNFEDPEAIVQRYPHELSGGMAQRIAIAMALAGEPSLLVADEPTTALDVTVQAEILTLLHELQETRGMALLLITHNWGVVADLCQRAYVMYAGHVVEACDAAQMFAEPRHPYTAALLSATPRRSSPRTRLPSIAGAVPDPTAWPKGCHFAPRCALATPACSDGPVPMLEANPGHYTRCIHHVDVRGLTGGAPSLA